MRGVDPAEVKQALELVLGSIPDHRGGLQDTAFEFLLKVTPTINVDLLIQDSRGTLPVWREDDFSTGWHVPGDITRFYQPLVHRISKVARLELGTTVIAEEFPCDLQQFFSRRGHFISLLYRCRLTSAFSEPSMLHVGGDPRPGAFGWFPGCPEQIYPGHEVYLRYFEPQPQSRPILI